MFAVRAAGAMDLSLQPQVGQGGQTHHSTVQGTLATLPQPGVSAGLAVCRLRTATLQRTYGNTFCVSVPLGHAPGRPLITPLLAVLGRATIVNLWWFFHPAAWWGTGLEGLQSQDCTAAAVRGREQTLTPRMSLYRWVYENSSSF